MTFNPFQRCSLKTRVTLFTLAIFLFSLWSLAFFASLTLRRDMQNLLSDQQFSTVSLIAEEVNQELGDRLRLLEKMAETVSPAMLDNPATLQAVLEECLILQMPFNAGIFATRLDGSAVARIPLSAGMIGVNYRDRDYIAGALQQGKTTIGQPVIGRVLRAPVFGIATPIRDPQGTVIGALAGITNLGQPNFLDRLANGRYGQSGGYLLIAPRHRQVVTASDKSRIMETLPAPGINPSIDRFLEGFEGSAVIRNPQGVEVLASDKAISAAGWIAAATLPTAEAFAPIRALQQRMVIATLFLTLLAGGLTWWILRRQLAPMLTAVRTLAAWSDTDSYPQPLPIAHRDEIGKLISSFNRLLEILERREQALVEQSANLTRVAMEREQAEASMRAAREQLESLTAAVPGVVYQLLVKSTGEWQFLYVSQGIHRLYGVTVEEALRDHLAITDCILPERRAAHRESVESATADLRFWEHEHQILTPMGQLKWVRAQALPQKQTDGSVLWNGVLIDITDRKQIEKALQESNDLFSLFMQHSPIFIYIKEVLPHESRVLKASENGQDIIGIPGSKMVGKTMEELFPADFAAKITADDWAVVYSGQAVTLNEDWNGHHYVTTKFPIYYEGKNLLAGYTVDMTERKQMEDQVRQLALYDTLTQLPNRRLLNDRLSQTLAAGKRSGCYGALMFLDLDNFKPLNDAHGHAVGDSLLIEAADRLKKCVREMDTIARFGGDEFVVILSELNVDKTQSTREAELVAEKIRLALSEPYRLIIKREGKADTVVEHYCTVSIGVVVFINHESSPDNLIKWADQAMYQAKEAGRNSIRFYEMG